MSALKLRPLQTITHVKLAILQAKGSVPEAAKELDMLPEKLARFIWDLGLMNFLSEASRDQEM